jgi:protein-tyrosine phosphatase
MVDIHTHILPEVDDGARSWEMAIHMCHMAAEDGVTHMVATPHANDEFFYDRSTHEDTLKELSVRCDHILEFSLGCDFHFSYENLEHLERDPQQFLISGTRYLLVEFSAFSIAPWVTTKLDEMLRSGILPIITHPERNPILQRKPEQVVLWAEMGCPVQVTANSLTGRWGIQALKSSHWLLRKHVVHLIASDCHDVEGRPPLLSEARKVLEKSYGAAMAKALTNDNPAAVVHNKALPFFPSVRDK